MGTPTLTRPLKTNNTRTYVEEVNSVAPADAPILAPEVDADLDTLYSAWNNPASAFPPIGAAGGDLAGSFFPAPVVAPNAITTAKVADAAIQSTKLADAPLGVTTAKVNDAAVTRAKIAADAWLNPVPAGADVGKVLGVTAGPVLGYVVPPGGPPTGAAGGDLVGSTYPNPVVGAGKITKAKLGPDVSGLVYQDLNTPQNVGSNTTAFVNLLDLSALGTLLVNRRYRLMTEGFWSKAVACDLVLAIWMGAPGQVVSGVMSPASITTESVYYLMDFTFLWFSAGNLWIRFNMTISSAVASGALATGFARSLIKVNGYTGFAGQPPLIQIGFSVANAGNGVTRYPAMVEVL